MQGVMDHIVLNAEDVEALLQFYTEVVELEPERVEAFHRGNGTSFYFHDPEGNEIEARYYGE